MASADRQAHWQGVYLTKGDSDVSWHEDSPDTSLALVNSAAAGPDAAIIDIGGGCARLVDALLNAGYRDVTVLDISDAALSTSRSRLGMRANSVTWIAADVTAWTPSRQYDVWHDRAAFHFLTDPHDRMLYVSKLQAALRKDGQAIIGTFDLTGPEKCSGLPVCRYDGPGLSAVLGPRFRLIEQISTEHQTPWGTSQNFQFSRFACIG